IMTDLFKNLKLDAWWGMVFYLGVGAIVSSFFFQIDFIESKHLFGLGLGMILIGLSFWMAERKLSKIQPPHFSTGGSALLFSWNEIRHNPITLIVLFIGGAMVCFFG